MSADDYTPLEDWDEDERAVYEGESAAERKHMATQAIEKHEGLSNGVSLAPPEWNAMREQASALVASGFLPKAINTAEKAIAVMLTGRELGLGPMQALRSVNIIEGKPSLGAELIAGLVYKRVPGATLRVVDTTNEECTVEACRPGQPVTTITWTLDDAKAAGLLSKDNWRKYPRAMLRSRAITEAARAVFPDATVGLYDPDELGAITTPDGQVVEVELPRISPHGEPEDGVVYRDPETADALIRQFEDSSNLEALRALWHGSGLATVDGYESFHPQDRKRLSTAYKRRERQLAKPARELDTKAAEAATEGDL